MRQVKAFRLSNINVKIHITAVDYNVSISELFSLMTVTIPSQACIMQVQENIPFSAVIDSI